jgi:hypothetical protein
VGFKTGEMQRNADIVFAVCLPKDKQVTRQSSTIYPGSIIVPLMLAATGKWLRAFASDTCEMRIPNRMLLRGKSFNGI